MELDTAHGRPVEDPGPEAIEDALNELEIDEGFLILARAGEDYVQAAPGVIEYRQEGRHFRHDLPEPDRDLVLSIFMSYYADDGKWKRLVPWEDVTGELERSLAGGGSRVWIVIVVVVLIIVAIALVVSRM